MESVGDGVALMAQAPPAAGFPTRLPRIPHRGRTARLAAACASHVRQGGEGSCHGTQGAARRAFLPPRAAPANPPAFVAPPALALSVSAGHRLTYPRISAWPEDASRRSPRRRRRRRRRQACSFPPRRERAAARAGRLVWTIHSPLRTSGTAPPRPAPFLDRPRPPASTPPAPRRPGCTRGSEYVLCGQPLSFALHAALASPPPGLHPQGRSQPLERSQPRPAALVRDGKRM